MAVVSLKPNIVHAPFPLHIHTGRELGEGGGGEGSALQGPVFVSTPPAAGDFAPTSKPKFCSLSTDCYRLLSLECPL